LPLRRANDRHQSIMPGIHFAAVETTEDANSNWFRFVGPICLDIIIPAPSQQLLCPVALSQPDSLVPHRHAMPPPELPADAPVFDVVHPVQVGLGPALRMKSDPAFLHRFDRS